MLLGRTLRELAYAPSISSGGGSGVGFEVPSAMYGGLSSVHTMADAAYATCLLSGLVLWGLGLVWYILGMSILLRHSLYTDRSYFSLRKFNLGWYATTFPIGVLATGAYIIAQELDSEAMRVIGAALAVQVVVSWVWVVLGHVRGVWQGKMVVGWEAPELAGAQAERRVWRRSGCRDAVSDLEKQ